MVLYIYICIYVYVCVCICICIYIYKKWNSWKPFDKGHSWPRWLHWWICQTFKRSNTTPTQIFPQNTRGGNTFQLILWGLHNFWQQKFCNFNFYSSICNRCFFFFFSDCLQDLLCILSFSSCLNMVCSGVWCLGGAGGGIHHAWCSLSLDLCFDVFHYFFGKFLVTIC